MSYSPTGQLLPFPSRPTMYPLYSLYEKLIPLALILATVLPFYSKDVSIKPSAAPAVVPAGTTSRPADVYGRLPLSFEPNQGQVDSRVKFIARGQHYGIFLTDNGAVFSFDGSSTVLRMQLEGAARTPRISGVDQLLGKVNYFLGNQSEKWRTNIPTYARVRYEQIYRGVDLIYYGNQKQLEYDFVIAPGASFKQIRLAFDGAGKLRLNRRGDLILKSNGQKITLLRPKAYQEIGQKKREISVRYSLKPHGEVSFQLASYDKSQPLVIDPVLVYSTYLGGNGQDQANSIAVDSSGNAYITGQTFSANFPTSAALHAVRNGISDIFVTKLNAAGSALIYSTYLGGNNSETSLSIACDASGRAYITGQTTSTDFPLVNPLDSTLGGIFDAFVAELNESGSALVYSTLLGGGSSDIGSSIAVDTLGNAYVTGSTLSRDFPTTNPLQANRSGNAIFKTTDSAGNWTASDSGLMAATVSDLAFHPTNSSIIYAATDTGLFKTTDAGVNWNQLSGFNPFPPNKVTLVPTDPSIIYVATNAGAFKSTDGGNTFTAINNGLNPAFVRLIVVDPVTPNTLYAVGVSNFVFKSIDGGANWTSGFINNVNSITWLIVDPNTPSTLYAATNRGVFKSTNSACSWTASNNGLAFGAATVNRVVIDATHNLLYAATSAGIFKSTDGASWTSINGNLPSFSVFLVAFDPANTSIIYLATTAGLQKTIDGGTTWNSSATGFPGPVVNALLLDPSQTSTLYVGTTSGSDAFVTKLSAGGTQVYSTYLGGSIGDAADGIAVDGAGDAYVTGSTISSNFPVANALQPVKALGTDAFVAKLNPNGSTLVYSTFLGGDGIDVGRSIAVDGNDNVFIGGTTSSQNFPTANAFQSTRATFSNDAFVAKINSAGSALVYSTYLGGDSNDECFAIAVDAAGSAYVTGTTDSFNFPTLGALQPAKNGFNPDAFITKLAPSGSSLIYSTYLGGTFSETGFGLALDASQNVYVVGATSSPDFPTVNPLQAALGGFTDVFIAKLRPAPEVEVTVSDSPDPVSFGSNLTYTINIKNNGEVAATGLTLTDTLPSGATLVSASSTAGTCTGTSSINCPLGTLNPGATATVTIVVTPPAVRTIVNTATVTLNETDSFSANNTATTETLVDFADFSIAKKAFQNLVAPGGTTTFSLIVKNKSGVPASATVTDNLPAGVSLIKCAATGAGVCGGNGNNVNVVFSQIAVGASEAILLTVGVNGSATEGTVINNTASVSSPVPDTDTSNNSATASVTVSAVTVLQKSNGIIAFGSQRSFGPNPQPDGIYTIKPDATDEKFFPNIPINAEEPEWSPDGSRLAFQVSRFNGFVGNEISVINADGTGLLKLAGNVADFNRSITWSPNGSQIAYIGAGQSNNIDSIRTNILPTLMGAARIDCQAALRFYLQLIGRLMERSSYTRMDPRSA